MEPTTPLIETIHFLPERAVQPCSAGADRASACLTVLGTRASDAANLPRKLIPDEYSEAPKCPILGQVDGKAGHSASLP